jgi:hypothetical protein
MRLNERCCRLKFNKENKMKKLTPMKAIRQHCYACCNQQWPEVVLCPAEGCPTWHFRFGKRAEGKAKSGYTATTAIKLQCLDCCGFERGRSYDCDHADCSLWNMVRARMKLKGLLVKKPQCDSMLKTPAIPHAGRFKTKI